MSNSVGRWMKTHGQFKRRAHFVSLIGGHVGVGQLCRAVDSESSATLPTMSTRINVPGNGTLRLWVQFGVKTHHLP